MAEKAVWIWSARVSEQRIGALYAREITSSLGVLGLLLIEMSGECDNVGVDLLVADGAALTVRRHVCGYMESLGVVRARGGFA